MGVGGKPLCTSCNRNTVSCGAYMRVYAARLTHHPATMAHGFGYAEKFEGRVVVIMEVEHNACAAEEVPHFGAEGVGDYGYRFRVAGCELLVYFLQ